jgi:hypothetical protein
VLCRICQQLICVSIDVQFCLPILLHSNKSRDYHKYLLFLWEQPKMKLPLVVSALAFSLHAVVWSLIFYLKWLLVV